MLVYGNASKTEPGRVNFHAKGESSPIHSATVTASVRARTEEPASGGVMASQVEADLEVTLEGWASRLSDEQKELLREASRGAAALKYDRLRLTAVKVADGWEAQLQLLG